jgi:hypothetical protein
MTLDEAIELGEYQPEYLMQFEEFAKLSRHGQLQLIRKALKNRHRQLITQYAEINNQLHFSKKPWLQEGLDKVMEKIQKLEEDRERLLVEYA